MITTIQRWTCRLLLSVKGDTGAGTQSESHLPPLASDGVFAVFASSTIDAPLEKVWATLLDFSTYKEWNAFVRDQKIVDSSKNTLTDQTPVEGSYVVIAPVHLPPTMGEPGLFGTGSAFVKITTLDHEKYRAAWETAGLLPRWLLHAERWQTLTQDENGRTKYETIEVFNGIIAYLVKFFVGSALSLGFKAMADGLKARAERT